MDKKLLGIAGWRRSGSDSADVLMSVIVDWVVYVREADMLIAGLLIGTFDVHCVVLTKLSTYDRGMLAQCL